MKNPGNGGMRVALVTGGADFIGVNLADRLARKGRRVLVYDSLRRPGVERNLDWLCWTHGEKIEYLIDDVGNGGALAQAVARAGQVFHCAGQVAVTTSVEEPATDFEVNARGTLNVQEAVRACPEPPPLLFTSTNKVYGRLSGLDFEEGDLRYAPTGAGGAHPGDRREPAPGFLQSLRLLQGGGRPVCPPRRDCGRTWGWRHGRGPAAIRVAA